jgi:uncharacterized protein YjbI with pentapeptide repeats
MGRCGHTFDLERWKEEHDQPPQIHPRDEIVEQVDSRRVWRCPHEGVEEYDGEEKCVFHLPTNERPDEIDPVEEFIAIVNGDRDAVDGEGQRPARFIDATFEHLDVDRERIGNEETIDLRHARISKITWDIGTIVGPVEAGGTVIEGRADFERATFKSGADFGTATFKRKADFEKTIFEGEANFGRATFENRADFGTATFKRKADFGKAIFKGEAGFGKATFEDEASFQETRFWSLAFFTSFFESEADFGKAIFKGEADFRQADFGSRTVFRRVTFEREAAFLFAIFDGEAEFKRTLFKSEADFRGGNFNSNVTFGMATFESEASFEKANFRGVAFFISATIKGEAHFPWTTFKHEANFGSATLEGEANFREVTFESGANLSELDLEDTDFRDADLTEVNLENAVLTRTKLYGADFTGARLYGTLFGDARISDSTTFIDRGVIWSPLRRILPIVNKALNRLGIRIDTANTVIYDPRTETVCPSDDAPDKENTNNLTRAATVYQTLESLARDNAASTLASTCFVWRKDMERKRYYSDEGKGNHRQIVRWGFSWLSNLVTRYGESPYRVLATSGLAILFSGVLYFALNLIKPVKLPGENSPPVTLFDAFYFSVLTFTTLGYGDFRPANQLGRFLAVSETSAGVILLALLVFVFGRRATR